MSASCYSLIKALVLNAIFVSLCIPTNAQTQRYTMTEDFTKQIETFEGLTGIRFSFGIPGNIKYSYKYSGDSDNKIKDGSLTINCHVSSCRDAAWSWAYTLKNGRYSVHANFKEGQLNGPYSAQLSYTMIKDTYYSWGDRTERSTGIESQSVTCSFKSGKPHGRFLMKGSRLGTVSATFNNGQITGLFSISGYTGNINSSGKPIGRWKMGENEYYNFQNGVLISKSNHQDSRETSLARKYATKQISKEGLSEFGYFVQIGSIDLKDRFWDSIKDLNLFDFKILNGYDFSTPNIVKYEYLEKRCTFTDKGFEKFCEIIQDAELTGYNYRYELDEPGILSISLNDNLTISDLVLEDSTHTFENTYIIHSDEPWETDDYIGVLKPYGYFSGIYLKHSQFQKLKGMTEFAQEEKDYINRVIEYSEVYTKPKFSKGDIYNWLLNDIKSISFSDSESEALSKEYVIVNFIVEKDGSIEYAYTLLGQNGIINAEAVNTILKMPKWTPGRDSNSDVVRVKCNIYIPYMMFIQKYNDFLKASSEKMKIPIK